MTSPRTVAVVGLLVAGLWTGPVFVAGQDREPLEVAVTEVWSTGDSAAFGFPGGMAQWPDGTVWVGDDRLAEVYEISADGNRTRVVLREGDGPREVSRVDWVVPSPMGRRGDLRQPAGGFLRRRQEIAPPCAETRWHMVVGFCGNARRRIRDQRRL